MAQKKPSDIKATDMTKALVMINAENLKLGELQIKIAKAETRLEYLLNLHCMIEKPKSSSAKTVHTMVDIPLETWQTVRDSPALFRIVSESIMNHVVEVMNAEAAIKDREETDRLIAVGEARRRRLCTL